MLKVDQYDLIRTSCRVYGKGIKQIAREIGHSKNTIKKVIRGEYTGYTARERQPFPVICICSGRPTGRAYRITYKDKQQKTQTVYVSRAQLPEARRMIANYMKIRKLLDQLFETNITLFKNRSKL